MLNKTLKSQLRGTLPSGITFRGDNALWVKRSKSYIHNGEKKEKTLTHTIKLGIGCHMTDAEARVQFEKQLAQACKTKADMIEKLSSRKFLEADVDVKTTDASLQSLYNVLEETIWKSNSSKHMSLIKQYFRDTLNFFAERDNCLLYTSPSPRDNR